MSIRDIPANEASHAVGKGNNVIQCSQCGVFKREVNHWYFAWLERGQMRFCVMPWEADPELAHEQTVNKLCGLQCLTITMAKWVGRGFQQRTA